MGALLMYLPCACVNIHYTFILSVSQKGKNYFCQWRVSDSRYELSVSEFLAKCFFYFIEKNFLGGEEYNVSITTRCYWNLFVFHCVFYPYVLLIVVISVLDKEYLQCNWFVFLYTINISLQFDWRIPSVPGSLFEVNWNWNSSNSKIQNETNRNLWIWNYSKVRFFPYAYSPLHKRNYYSEFRQTWLVFHKRDNLCVFPDNKRTFQTHLCVNLRSIIMSFVNSAKFIHPLFFCSVTSTFNIVTIKDLSSSNCFYFNQSLLLL